MNRLKRSRTVNRSLRESERSKKKQDGRSWRGTDVDEGGELEHPK